MPIPRAQKGEAEMEGTQSQDETKGLFPKGFNSRGGVRCHSGALDPFIVGGEPWRGETWVCYRTPFLQLLSKIHIAVQVRGSFFQNLCLKKTDFLHSLGSGKSRANVSAGFVTLCLKWPPFHLVLSTQREERKNDCLSQSRHPFLHPLFPPPRPPASPLLSR